MSYIFAQTAKSIFQVYGNFDNVPKKMFKKNHNLSREILDEPI